MKCLNLVLLKAVNAIQADPNIHKCAVLTEHSYERLLKDRIEDILESQNYSNDDVVSVYFGIDAMALIHVTNDYHPNYYII